MNVYFTTRPGLFSWLIRKATGQPYSHVAVHLANGYIYESIYKGCHKVLPEEFLKKNTVIRSFTNLPESYQNYFNAEDFLGRAYDIPAILWFGVVAWAKRRGINLPYLCINPDWMICSEYVWYIMYTEKRTVTPEDVYRRITHG